MAISPAGIFAMDKRKTLVVSVDYSLPIEGYLSIGKYDYVPTYALERIPVRRRSGTVQCAVTIFPNKVSATTEAVQRELRALRHRATDSHEILAVGADEPDLQRNGKLIALNAVWHDGRNGGPRALGLTSHNGLRKVDFFWPSFKHGYEWSPGHFFAAVQLL